MRRSVVGAALVKVVLPNGPTAALGERGQSPSTKGITILRMLHGLFPKEAETTLFRVLIVVYVIIT